jgi:extradiol dioxygenase family protein
MGRPCFHLSIPSHDLAVTERWYVDGLGCVAGRRSDHALILDLQGHQLVVQRTDANAEPPQSGIYPRHFGLVFESLSLWQHWLERARTAGLRFGVEPKLRFPGEVLEHHTFFLIDPAANWLEFKHYSDATAVLGCLDQRQVGDRDLRYFSSTSAGSVQDPDSTRCLGP